jgi:PII-like signaling protein
MHETHKHGSILLYEWLLEFAKKQNVHGGSAFRAIAGFGRHGVLHEQHFFELQGDLTVVVEFLLADEEADAFLKAIESNDVNLFYAKIPATFGVIGQKA